MLTREVEKGETLILRSASGRLIGTTEVLTVTPYRIYTKIGSFDNNGVSLNGRGQLYEKTPELIEEVENEKIREYIQTNLEKCSTKELKHIKKIIDSNS